MLFLQALHNLTTIFTRATSGVPNQQPNLDAQHSTTFLYNITPNATASLNTIYHHLDHAQSVSVLAERWWNHTISCDYRWSGTSIENTNNSILLQNPPLERAVSAIRQHLDSARRASDPWETTPGCELKRQARCFCDTYFDHWREPAEEDILDALRTAEYFHLVAHLVMSRQQKALTSLVAAVRAVLEFEDLLEEQQQIHRPRTELESNSDQDAVLDFLRELHSVLDTAITAPLLALQLSFRLDTASCKNEAHRVLISEFLNAPLSRDKSRFAVMSMCAMAQHYQNTVDGSYGFVRLKVCPEEQ